MQLPTLSEINDERSKIQKKFKSDMDALDGLERAVMRFSTEHVPGSANGTAKTAKGQAPEPEPATFETVIEAVTFALRHLPEELTSVDVVRVLRGVNPRFVEQRDPSSFSGCLIRMAEKGEQLQFVERGSGKKPTVYRQVSAVQPASRQ